MVYILSLLFCANASCSTKAPVQLSYLTLGEAVASYLEKDHRASPRLFKVTPGESLETTTTHELTVGPAPDFEVSESTFSVSIPK